jgi:hypothetical protein
LRKRSQPSARHIVALGGGGFSMEPDNPLLDDFVLSLARRKRRPRICFMATATGDSDSYIRHFHEAFPPSRAAATHLTFFERKVSDLKSLMKKAVLLALLGEILLLDPAWAWFAEGHEIVAVIVAGDLAPTARANVAQILGVAADVASVAKAMAAASIRPDTEFRNEDRSTASWHLPMPGSPVTKTIWRSPCNARSSHSWSCANSA